MRGRRLCAPHLLDCEVASVALAKMRQGLDAGGVRQAMRMHALAELERHPVDAIEVFELASRAKLSAYDAAYLWLARTLGAPLATFDAKLGAAALRELRDG
jgi:predicted nucleic acid-binding protein